MKLLVHVHDELVATVESTDGFRHVLAYHPDAPAARFVSLLMPVRTGSYAYPDLHPSLRMNLPEGFPLSVLQEQIGPHGGASPLDLLAVVGRNTIGRVTVSMAGADPAPAPLPFELATILRGDNSEDAFAELVRRYAPCGVSGVVPKFLSPEPSGKGRPAVRRHIVKGPTARLPGLALNEHFCMAVARLAGIDTAVTEVSDDGQALAVQRFDFEADGVTRKGLEDLCCLLALRPEEKYQSSWERVAGRILSVVPAPALQNAVLSQLADLLLLSYALRNAGCHTKNIALLYTSREQIALAPVYDMATTTVYDDYAQNPPALSLDGRSSWTPGKGLERFLQTRCGVKPAQVRERVERICQAMVQVTPQVVEATRRYPAFQETGKRMLHAWNEGMHSLRLQKTWSLPSLAGVMTEARL
jgi:serine/threonine-protein kinase HipA